MKDPPSDAQGVAIRGEDLSALPLLKHFSVSEAARASRYLYTTQADIDEFIKALHQSIASDPEPPPVSMNSSDCTPREEERTAGFNYRHLGRIRCTTWFTIASSMECVRQLFTIK